MMTDQGKMRIGRILVLLALATVLISLSTGPAYAITIKGNIINMDEVNKYAVAGSYLQLVAKPGSEGIKVRTDNNGLFFYESNLPQAKMSKAGAFSISAPGLKPGRYNIVIQKTGPVLVRKGEGVAPPFSTSTYRTWRVLVRKGEGVPLEIEVAAGADQSTLDLGEVYIPVPNSKYF